MIDWSQYPNFSEREFRCTHTGACAMRPELLDVLQRIRNEFGRPMPISSGYRDPSHPIEAAKTRPGSHAMGVAADIAVSGPDALRIVELAIKHGIRRIGVHQRGTGRFIHLDIGGHGLPSPAIWTY